MQRDLIAELLDKVASGKVNVKDARKALEGASLTESEMDSAINHGVFNPAEPGTIISASIAPSGASALTFFFFVWGIFWSIYWIGTMLYGLFNGWAQQQLSFHLAMAITVIILMGIIYMKYVLPDKIIVKHRRNKYVPEHPKDWVEYKW